MTDNDATTRLDGDVPVSDRDDDELETIRYSLTALGETMLGESRGPRFRGFGPCMAVA